MSNIGFIGLGHMGLHMAHNLVKSTGTRVIGFDVSQPALTAFRQLGGVTADSVAEIARTCGVIITMLPKGEHVDAVMNGNSKGEHNGNNSIFANARPGTLLIDSSTIDIETSVRLAEQARLQGLDFMDAPVSGGEKGAKDGTLSFMVGADPETYNKAKPVLEMMGKNLFYVGKNGSGLAVKLVNNMLLGVCMAATGEAFNLINKLGVDAHIFHTIVSRSSGANWALEKNCPVPGLVESSPANNDYRPGFANSLMLKDLSLAQQVAMKANAPSPLGSAALSLFSMAEKSGLGNQDMSSILKLFSGDK
ncbi:MAG: 3-hydroxyisobutyrate dehydrogenase [Enterobacteriaceae bacterium]|jgi:3-hydroxyisobutyrate dehydrogenase|nr:3-hydroxyisobutyrate dehydrogenase [Enterobacteriaceae bacterium]